MGTRSYIPRSKLNKMAKNKDRRQDRSEVKHLQGIIQEKDKQIRQLTRLVKYLENRKHFDETTKDDEKAEEVPQEEPKIECTECGKGHYENFFSIMDKVYATCDTCETPKRLK